MSKLITKILESINKILIPIFVKQKMYYLLSLLLIVNLKKIKKTLPRKKLKYKAIVLHKSGGIDDLIESQRKFNNDILFLSCPRSFFKQIFNTIINIKKHSITDNNYASKNKQINNLKLKYKNFLGIFIKTLNDLYFFNFIIGFNFNYHAERELHNICHQLKIPFLLIYKESVRTEIQRKYQIHMLKKTNEKINVYKVAVYSKTAKKFLTDVGIINRNNIEVVGCPRLNASFNYKNIVPKNQILYYAIEKYRGLPQSYVKSIGKSYFKDLECHKLYNENYNWQKLHLRTLKILKKFAKKNPEIPIIIKVKTSHYNQNDYKNLPKNITVYKLGVGHSFLEESKIVIAWNTTSILESIAANRFILLPYFHKKNLKLKKEDELILNLREKNYGFSEDDFYKKLNIFLKKKYKKNNINNNQSSLKYYLGNLDNRAGKRLDKFLRNNIFYEKV